MSGNKEFLKSEEFFKSMADFRVQGYYLGEVQRFEVEDLYQAFKARLIRELVVDIEHCSTQALLSEADDF